MTIPFWVGGLLIVSGCASLSDYHYEYTQHARARSQYREAGNPSCSKYPKDYKKGWIDGFYEVTTGGSTCPPAVAPECYWKPGQILNDCDNRRHEYYSGWQDGAARAGQFPDTHYLRIYETCECPFPRCQCNGCGHSPCSCVSATCGTCQQETGMVYHSGTIEADREIMMVPIPTAEDELHGSTGELPPARNTLPSMMPQPAGASEVAVPVVETDNESEAVLPSPDSAPVAIPIPVMKAAEGIEPQEPAEPISPSDPVIGGKSATDAGSDLPPQATPVPQPERSESGNASTDETAPGDAEPTVRYQYSDDNSVTIDFGPPQSVLVTDTTTDVVSETVSETVVLSDFDVQLDGGLIE
ncbi:MAG: hypothetical protein KDB00_21355 [Planctomycetales bacterium]|nr:hypothetical protein [Planctomycetales bacterium]